MPRPDFIIDPHEVLASTNETALARIRKGQAAHGMVITSKSQTAGRGRQGRVWHSPAGNLYASIILMPRRPKQDWPQLALLTGLAVVEALPDYDLKLKWPNDLLCGESKLGGILCEIEGDAVVLGLGLNIAHAPEDPDRAITGLAAMGYSETAETALSQILPSLSRLYEIWSKSGLTARLRDRWQSHAACLGQTISIHRHGQETLEGIYHGISPAGALLVDVGDMHYELHSGEIQQMRPKGEPA